MPKNVWKLNGALCQVRRPIRDLNGAAAERRATLVPYDTVYVQTY